MEKKDKKEIKKKKDKEDISQEWFEDHEDYDDEEDSSEEGEKDEVLDDDLYEESEFNSRVRHFLANQKKDVSLERMVEFNEDNVDENLPLKKKEEEIGNEEIFDYMTGNKIEGLKYQAMEPETIFSRPDLSSSERILEEQKALYSHLKDVGGEAVARNKNEWNPVTTETIKGKNYLTGKKFTTGPY